MHQDDECWYLQEFSVITGLSSDQLSSYELAMCKVLDFELVVQPRELLALNRQLLRIGETSGAS